MVQHHHIPSVDVLSYTAQGEHWIYPVGAGVFFYAAFLLGGFPLLSVIGAVGCAGTVAWLLRRGSAASAGIAILAVPLIAVRTPPRAEMFTVLFSAAFLSILWQYYQTGRAPLWLLPPLMLVWTNVHFGFAGGLGLILAYAGTELLEMVCGETRRHAALDRLRRAWIWFAGTALVTLANPWGWGLYRALALQLRSTTYQQTWIVEWQPVRVNWDAAKAALTLGGPKGALIMLLAIAVIAAALAVFRRQPGAAVLLLGASYAPVQHIRMGALFASVAVVVGGPLFDAAALRIGSWIRPLRLRPVLAGAAVAVLAALAFARSFDLVTNGYYSGSILDYSAFGAGLSWWFPRRAAEFIQRENLPGEILNNYDAGGYLTWKLGPQRRVYIDGRDTLFGIQRVDEYHRVFQSPPDSPAWEQETSRFHINTVILSIDGIQHAHLKDLCYNAHWRPVYLDEVSAVFVRRTPQTEALIQRFPVDCVIAPLPVRTPGAGREEQFVAWSNAADVLIALGRNLEALDATQRALAVFPRDAEAHFMRGSVLYALGRRPEAEPALLTAVSLSPTEFTWATLANLYFKEDRSTDGIRALRTAAELSPNPSPMLLQLGYHYLDAGRARDALEAFDEAVRSVPADAAKATGRFSFSYDVATGRAQAWRTLGDARRAASFQEEAVRLAPNSPQPWLNLAQIYQIEGRSADADRARSRAATLTENQSQ